MTMNHKKSKATDIPARVRKIVGERDNGQCIICGNWGRPNAHYISRERAGLGIPENIVTLCDRCHHEYDHGKTPEEYEEKIRNYLNQYYTNWPSINLVYDKWAWTKGV